MLRPFGAGLPSDAIFHRFGSEGNEPRETEALCEKFAVLGVRSMFAINTCYNEVAGGYYVNPALFALLDQAMQASGVFRVLLDIWRSDGLVPVEDHGHFVIPEEYAIVDNCDTMAGLLQVWQFNAGGGGAYYGDNIIFDFLLPNEVTRQISDQLEIRCRGAGVRFRRCSQT